MNSKYLRPSVWAGLLLVFSSSISSAKTLSCIHEGFEFEAEVVSEFNLKVKYFVVCGPDFCIAKMQDKDFSVFGKMNSLDEIEFSTGDTKYFQSLKLPVNFINREKISAKMSYRSKDIYQDIEVVCQTTGGEK